MTANRMSPATSLMCAAASGALVMGVWGWRASVFRAERLPVNSESWDRVKTEYPLPDESAALSVLSAETAEAVVRANPFSPLRRFVPPPPDQGTDGKGGVPAVIPAQFAYKGRVNLGNRQRAILENLATHKTYFLEVGQEVAGFKVLDIAENRVVLSDPQTNKEVVVSLTSSSKSP